MSVLDHIDHIDHMAAAFDAIRAVDAACADRDDVARTLREVTTLRNWLDSVEVDHALR